MGKDLRYTKLVLDNGANLYVLPMPWAKTVGLCVHVNTGTREEVWPKEAGLAHAVEHMVFQGTEKFPDSKTLSEYLENVGGIINAATWNELTFFFNCLPCQEKNRGFEVLSQQVLKPLFLPERIKTEMQNVVHEIHRKNDNPPDFLGDKFSEVLYGEHPLSKCTLGLEKSVLAFERKDFRSFWQRLYHPSNFTFLAVGNIKPKEALKSFGKYFPKMASQLPNKREFLSLPSIPEDVTIQKKIEQAHVMLGTSTSGCGQRDSLILDFFRTMIGGGMSFPLFVEVRDKKGLCYQIGAEFWPWSDVGIFTIYLGTSPEKIEEAVDLIIKVVNESKTSRELLEKAKEFIRGRLAFKFESVRNILWLAALDITFKGKPGEYKEKLDEIQSITIEEVEQVVNRYLTPERLLKVSLIPESYQK